MTRNKKADWLIFLVVLLSASCGPVPQTGSGIQSFSPGFVFPTGSGAGQNFLSAAEVLLFDEMESVDQGSWEVEHGIAQEGHLLLSKSGAENPFLSGLHVFQPGEGVLFLFRYDNTAQFEIGMQRGEWETPAFKRWGLYQLDELTGNIWDGTQLVEPARFFTGSLSMQPDRWYYLLLLLDEEDGVQYIWEQDNPSNAGELIHAFESGWRQDSWQLVIQVFEGQLEIDEAWILQAGAGGVVADSAPTQTAEPVASAVTADIIFYNGSVLTLDPGMEIAQAVAVQGETILAVGGNDQVLTYSGEDTRLVDLGGMTIMPGFVDPHTHVFDSGSSVTGIGVWDAQQEAIENGVTTLAGFMNEEQLNTLQQMSADGSLRIRTDVYLVATGACGEMYGSWYRDFPVTRAFGEMLRVNGIKIFTDGGTCGYAAVAQETHPGAGLGNLWFTQQQLDDMVREAHQAGYQVSIHALGDRAIQQAQEAIIRANEGSGNPLRHRIEHNYYLSDDLLPRYLENEIYPVIFGQFPTCALPGLTRTEYWRQTIARWRELLAANPGLPIAAKSDTPYVGEEKPLLSLFSLVTMQEVAQDGSRCMPPDWLAERTVTVEEALPMLTSHAAYMLFREDEVGSLEAGKLADLIVLSGNPLQTNPEDLVNLEVWMTMIGGKVEYCASGHETVCP